MTQSQGRLAAFNGPVLPFARAKGAKPAVRVQAKTESEGEVWIYGDIVGDAWFDSDVTAKALADELKALGPVTTLHVYINSGGGSVFEGVAIYNTLRRHRARKVVHVDGLAASIASVIAMAGDEIRIAANGMMMIHNPWGIAMGEAGDFRKMADALDKIGDVILDTYALRTGGERDELAAQMNAETWFNAEEAVAAGLADTAGDAVEAAAFAGLDVSNFRRTPESLRRAAEAPPAPAAEPDQSDVVAEVGKPHLAVARTEARLRARGLLTA